MWPALIAAGGSILGALVGKQKAISAGDNAYSHVQGTMRAAKEFGFNPLTLLGSVGAVGGTQGQNFMGQAIADAGLMLANSYAAKASAQDLARNNQLEQQNRNLLHEVQQQTLRPKVAGIYGGSVLTPSLGTALRVTPGSGIARAASAPSGARFAPNTLPPLGMIAPVYDTPPGIPISDDPVQLSVPFVLPNGQMAEFPVGFDMDQGLTGLAMLAYPWAKANPGKAVAAGAAGTVGLSAATVGVARAGSGIVTGMTNFAKFAARRAFSTPPLIMPPLPNTMRGTVGRLRPTPYNMFGPLVF